MFIVTIESRIWGCGYTHTHRSRKSAFVAVMRYIMDIPDATLRPTIPEMITAYEDIGNFSKGISHIWKRFDSNHTASDRGNSFVLSIVRE